MPMMELPTPTPVPDVMSKPGLPVETTPAWSGRMIQQLLRFGLVGCLNTLIDLLALNALLWLWPTRNTAALLLYNSLAYVFGALNSFLLNKYWTFQRKGRANAREVTRFTLTTLAGIACNDLLLWMLSHLLQPAPFPSTVGMNLAKVLAIGGTVLISYLGMRLWVFAQSARPSSPLAARSKEDLLARERPPACQFRPVILEPSPTSHSLSVVLPAYNEEEIIATTVMQVLRVLDGLLSDFEVIMVNDGSTDHTGDILANLGRTDARLRVITHERNQGYGATLADGFAAATKELTFFMDSDGQFDIRELQRFLPLIDSYDAVIGYRQDRQDTWLRKLNAWSWKLLIRLTLNVRARDIDCAFKLLRTAFLHRYPLTTRGAMINAELLYQLKHANYTVKELDVRHLPRQSGRATGANPRVIARALRELLRSTLQWRRAEAHEREAATHVMWEEDSMIETQKIATLKWSGKRGEAGALNIWQKLALGAVMLISIFLNFYQLGQSGFGNLFYAAGVRSMTDNLHNFFFVAYDPGGFVTIDKPPLGFWLQAISVKLFGFTPFSLFLPQALSGVLAVLVLFWLVRRHFGATAGLLAALALALSPLSVVTARNNTIDSVLVLTLLLGAWAIMLAAETGKWRWLLLSAVLVGLGFNVKMLEAYLVVPAFGLLYLLAAPRRIWMRLAQLLVALLVLLAVSLSWALVVDLTPTSQRPYVGSSKDNSEISLAFGYNGVDRLLGRSGQDNHAPAESAHPSTTSNAAHESATNQSNGNATEEWARQSFAGFGSGTPGPLRLFTVQLGGQISWLLPIALLGMLALIWQRRPRFRHDRQQQSLLLWGIWLLTMSVFFSLSRFFHTYYMTTFAPAICALFGIGLVVMWRDYLHAGWRGWLLPLALLATAAEQIFFIVSNPAWGVWLIPLIALSCALAALILSMVHLRSHWETHPPILVPALSLGVAALLLTPAVWSALPALQNMAISTPSAGPARQQGFGNWHGASNTTNPALISYLKVNQGNAKFLLATPNSMTADPFILATNQPVMAMGGFAGADPILTPTRLANLVADGAVRFFLLTNFSRRVPFVAPGNSATDARPDRLPGLFGFGRNSQSALTTWVKKHCTAVQASKWQTTSSVRGQARLSNLTQLYDCTRAK